MADLLAEEMAKAAVKMMEKTTKGESLTLEEINFILAAKQMNKQNPGLLGELMPIINEIQPLIQLLGGIKGV